MWSVCANGFIFFLHVPFVHYIVTSLPHICVLPSWYYPTYFTSHPSTSHLHTYTSFSSYLHSDYDQSKCHTDLVSCIISYFYVFPTGVRMVNGPMSIAPTVSPGCTTENVIPCPNSWTSPWCILLFLTKIPTSLSPTSYSSLHDITANFIVRDCRSRPCWLQGPRLPRREEQDH